MLLVLIFVAFISLGLPDGLLGVAWPAMRAGLGLPLDALGVLLAAGTAGYIASSFASGQLIGRFGVGKVLAVSCALTGACLFGYTLAPSMPWMALLALGLGLGGGAVDAGLNTYVARNFGERVMQWMHACYGVGVTLGPLLMTLSLARFGHWQWGYSAVGVAQWALAVAFLATLPLWRPKLKAGSTKKPRKAARPTPMRETLSQSAVWRSLALFMLYAGAEFGLGVWTYSLLTESRQIAPAAAGLWSGSYWAMFSLGRIAAGFYTRYIGGDALVRLSLASALSGSILFAWNPFASSGLMAVAIIGLAIAPIFPALVSSTSQRVGARHASNTIGMQMSAAGLGMALIPGLMGVLAERVSLEAVPLCMVALFIALLVLHGGPKRVSA